MNLFWFLTAVVQYTLSWDKQNSIRKIKKMLDESGAVWQKFAQMLSTSENLIDAELAMELQQMLYDCPVHSDEYSRKTIYRAFGDKYDLSDMKLIGSGTIAQVYKIGDICIKVRHPNVVEEVDSAVAAYNEVKDSYFMPVALKSMCDQFFNGLLQQVNFHQEFANGNKFKRLLHGRTDGTNNLFVIPRMLDYADECLVMEYEPSEMIVLKGRDKMSDHVVLRTCYCMSILIMLGALYGFGHGDIHFGNYGVRDDKIVLYDFGMMLDISEIDHTLWVKAHQEYDPELVFDIYRLDEHIRSQVYAKTGAYRKGDSCFYFKCMHAAGQHVALHSVKLHPHRIRMINMSINAIPTANIVSELETQRELKYFSKYQDKHGYARMLAKYFPYDDVIPIIDFEYA